MLKSLEDIAAEQKSVTGLHDLLGSKWSQLHIVDERLPCYLEQVNTRNSTRVA